MFAKELSSIFILWLLPEGSLQGHNERRLLHFLFTEQYYNPLERPVSNESQPIRVNFTMVLQQIIDVDEKNQIINTNIWLQMKWIAENLRWDPYEFGGISVITLPAKNIWKPDILLYNSADEKFDGTYHTNIVVKNDGSCLWVPPGMFKSTCSIDISWFPFDDQRCDMKFGSWSHDGRLLDLQMEDPSGGDTSSFIRNGEWDLIALPGHRNIKAYECCPEFFIDIIYTIHIRRRTLYYGFNIIIPCLLISTMSLLLFLLPPDSGEKISLGVTILLSLMVFLLLVAETMPPTSDAVPLIGIYFCCIMVMCGLSVAFTVIVLNFHHRGPETHNLPVWVKRCLNGWLARKLWLSRPGMEKRRRSVRQRSGDVPLHDRSAHALLPNLLETEEEYRARAENGMCGVPIQADDWIRPPTSQGQQCQQRIAGIDIKQSDDSTNVLNHDLIAIHRELKKITSKIKQMDEEEHIKSEWKFAAIVIDRLCLWICVTLTLISTLAILISAPHLVA